MLSVFHRIFGVLLVVAGLVILPMPLPFGLIMITIGLALLAPYFPAVQKLIIKMRRKWPDLDKGLQRYRDRMPPVIKKTIDKTTPHAAE